jgi:hypothetical protein
MVGTIAQPAPAQTAQAVNNATNANTVSSYPYGEADARRDAEQSIQTGQLLTQLNQLTQELKQVSSDN